MTPHERVWAALRGEAVDRPPISFWGHFYHRESSAADLVDATIEFQARYHWDWVKLNPRKHYHVEPWGVRYQYSGRPGEKPLLESVPIRSGDDWNTINEVSHEAGALGEQLDAVRRLRRAAPGGRADDRDGVHAARDPGRDGARAVGAQAASVHARRRGPPRAGSGDPHVRAFRSRGDRGRRRRHLLRDRRLGLARLHEPGRIPAVGASLRRADSRRRERSAVQRASRL